MIQAYWDQFLSWWPWGDRLLFVFCFCFGHSITTLPYNFIALILHVWPNKKIEQWKIQQDTYPSARLVKEVVGHVLVSHFVTSPLFTYFVVWPLFQYLEMPIYGPIPSLGRLLLEFLVCAVVNDFLFYWSHRFLHSHTWIYRNFHSQHHRFTAPLAWAAEYSSVTESLFASTIPTIAGCFIMRSHLFTITVWLMVRMLETLDAHSGFNFTWAPWRIADGIMLGPDGHDWHHSHNRENYGMFRFWDWLCGTDKEYKKWLRGEPTEKFSDSRSPVAEKKLQ